MYPSCRGVASLQERRPPTGPQIAIIVAHISTDGAPPSLLNVAEGSEPANHLGVELYALGPNVLGGGQNLHPQPLQEGAGESGIAAQILVLSGVREQIEEAPPPTFPDRGSPCAARRCRP